MKYTIRKAKVCDVPGIHSLINSFAKKDQMLPRAMNDIYENLQCYFVAESRGKIVGCCSLSVTWEDLAEIRSLAVNARYAGRGIGKKLVSRCIQEAKTLGVKRVFALTFKPGYFRHFGFTDIPKEELPHKVWADCIRCHLFPDCGEVPLIKTIVDD